MNKFCQSLGLVMLAIKQKKQVVRIPRSKFGVKLFYLFYKQGIIKGFTFSHDLKHLLIFLKYVDHVSLLKGFRFISKPSRYVYVSNNKLLKFFYSYGFFVISTSDYGFCFLHDYLNQNYIKKSFNDNNNNTTSTKYSGGVLLFQIYI